MLHRFYLRCCMVRDAVDRTSFETLIALATAVAGGVLAFSSYQPPSILAALSEPYRTLWAMALLTGGTLAVFGIHYSTDKDMHAGWVLEIIGLQVMRVCWLVQALALLTRGTQGIVFILLTLAVGVACSRRARWVVKERQAVSEEVRRRV